MMQKEFYKGSSDYNQSTKKFIPDEGKKKIRSMLKEMELSVSADKCEGSFYYRPSDNSWWHLSEYETSESTLERVTREHIEKNYPYIECDNRVPVDWID
jgi:hypothetical protein